MSETSVDGLTKAPPCACVSDSPFECARRRDGEEWYDTKRACECSCHDEYYDHWDDE